MKQFDDFVLAVTSRLGASEALMPMPADDLGLDSLIAAELLFVIEDLCSKRVLPDAPLPSLLTWGDAFAYYEALDQE
ncbi:MAG: hypothetical protein IPO44_02065 [Candidatus Microthrix sp.]|nr:hypothetical protein [Candidatus Microthrix sp.]MBK9558396.1 hypothetical protein [Candidatus Microthrix sp.]